MTDIIEPGDHVRIGASRLTWKVVGHPSLSWGHGETRDQGVVRVLLRSGQTERHRIEPLANLHLHTKAIQ